MVVVDFTQRMPTNCFGTKFLLLAVVEQLTTVTTFG